MCCEFDALAVGDELVVSEDALLLVVLAGAEEGGVGVFLGSALCECPDGVVLDPVACLDVCPGIVGIGFYLDVLGRVEDEGTDLTEWSGGHIMFVDDDALYMFRCVVVYVCIKSNCQSV